MSIARKRITVAALGTRGDVQPVLALCLGLSAAGHTVTVVAGSNFVDWVAGHGLRAVPTVDIEAVMNSERAEPRLIHETAEPEPSHIRPDPQVLYRAPIIDDELIATQQPPREQPPGAQPANPFPKDPDHDLIAFARCWYQLSESDRRELLLLAEFKAKKSNP